MASYSPRLPDQSIAVGKLPRHDRMNRRASFEIARQCRREGFRALKYRLALRGHGRQRFPLTGNLPPPIPCRARDTFGMAVAPGVSCLYHARASNAFRAQSCFASRSLAPFRCCCHERTLYQNFFRCPSKFGRMRKHSATAQPCFLAAFRRCCCYRLRAEFNGSPLSNTTMTV